MLSTAPLTFGNFTVDTGVSLASPLAAVSSKFPSLIDREHPLSVIQGCAAVLLAARREQGLAHDPATLRRRLITTASPLGLDSRFQSVGQQGNGVVQLHQALLSDTSLDTSFLALNDTRFFQGEHSVQGMSTAHIYQILMLMMLMMLSNLVTNDGQRTLEYSVSLSRSQTNYPFDKVSSFSQDCSGHLTSVSSLGLPSGFNLPKPDATAHPQRWHGRHCSGDI